MSATNRTVSAMEFPETRGNIDAVLALIGPRFGDRLSTGQVVREQHGRDVSYLPAHAPDAVVYPETADEVTTLMSLCHLHGVPVVPFGAGTSCEGHIAALSGGICMDMSRMTAIKSVSPADMTCVVEPGVTRKALNAYLRDSGLFFPVDPGADASIGGMISTGASGTNAVRYGTVRDHVVSLDVILADGTKLRTKSEARKSSAGYNLTQLFVGAEGTLGVVVSATLVLRPIPEAAEVALIAFGTSRQAIDCAIEIMGSGIQVARLEYLDNLQMAAIDRFSAPDMKVADTLIVECSGDPASVKRQIKWINDIANEHQALDFKTAGSLKARNRVWQIRHDAWWAALALRPGASGIPTDSCVPVSRLGEAIALAQVDCTELGLTAPICGHVGDGNFHLCIVFHPDDPDEKERVDLLLQRLSMRAIEFNGTITGEHGIGYGKRDYLVKEHGAEAVRVMAALKRALDPRNIMNPGKIVHPVEYAPFN